MRWCKKDKKCECLAALKTFVSGSRVRVELDHGLMFIDEVVGVVTEGGQDYAVFGNNPRVKVSDIGLVEMMG